MDTATASVRSFVDLRAFAAAAAPPPAVPGDSYLSARTMLTLPAGPLSIATGWPAGAGTVAPQDANEFLFVLSGTLTLATASTSLGLSPDDSAVISCGVGFDWQAAAATQVLFFRCASDSRAGGQPLKIDVEAALAPSNPPAADLLIGPTPACRNHTDHRSAAGDFSAGTWDSTPYHRRAMTYRHCELMHLLEGSVTFVDGAGRAGTFRRGDLFVVEPGAQCSWESVDHVKKVFAIWRPAAA